MMELALLYTEMVMALFFFVAGGSKLFWGREALIAINPYAAEFSDTGFRWFGIGEFAASFGLVLPIFVGGLELLAPISAAVLVVLQGSAGLLHWRATKNRAYLIFTLLLLAGLMFIIWGRLGSYPL